MSNSVNHSLHARIDYVDEYDITVVTGRGDRRSPIEVINSAFLSAEFELGSWLSRTCSHSAPTSWVFVRDNRNNIVYYDENRANVITVGQAKNTLTTIDCGLVIYDTISDIELIEVGPKVTVFGLDRIRDATNHLVDILKHVNLVYKRPFHLQERRRPVTVSDQTFKRILEKYYGWQLESIAPLPGGRGRTAFLVVGRDGKRAVLKLLTDSRSKAPILVNLQRSSDVFPRLYPIIHKDSKVVGDFSVEVGKHCYVLEEFITLDRPSSIDAEYYYRFGRNLGSFHNQMSRIQSTISVDIAGLNTSALPPNLVDVMLLDLNVAYHKLSASSVALSPTKNFLKENYEFLISKLGVLRDSDYIRAFNALPKQIVHGDISVLHSFFGESESMRLIDIETMCYTSRTFEFPIALIGRGAGNASIYLQNSFQRLICGYNETAQNQLSLEEIEIIKLLIIHRFFHMFQVWLIRNPIHDIHKLEVMLDSLRRFLMDNPLDINVLKKPRLNLPVPSAIPFDLPRNMRLFSSNWVSDKDAADLPSVSDRLQRNLFYAYAPPEVRHALPSRIAALSNISDIVLSFLGTKYPTLEVKNISLFGSFLYSKFPNDIDLLVVVAGNHYSLDTIPFNLPPTLMNVKILTSIEKIGISIKGEENLRKIVFNHSVSIPEESQKPVLERTVAALYHRHVTLFGFDFEEVPDILSDNALAESSDLLINIYHRFYMTSPKYKLSDEARAYKILSRLYEASIYLCSHNPHFSTAPIDVRNRLELLSKSEIDFEGVKRFYRYFVTEFEKVVADYGRNLPTNDEAQPARFISTPLKELDYIQMKSLARYAREMVERDELGDFLPVVSRLVNKDGDIIATGHRMKYEQPTDYGVYSVHAEMKVIDEAKAKGFSDWQSATLYTNLEPCVWCTRALAESYGIRRVIYGLEDTTLAEYSENRETFAREGIEFRQVVVNDTRAELLLLFHRLLHHEQYGSDQHRTLLYQRQDLTFRFNENYRNISGQYIQSEYFDADLLFQDNVNEHRELFWLSHLEYFQSNRNLDRPHVLLLGGNEKNLTPVLKRIFGDGIYNGRIVFARPDTSFDMQDLLWISRGDKAFVFDYDNTLVDAGESIGPEAASWLARFLLAGNTVVIVTSRSSNLFIQNSVELPSAVLKSLEQLEPNISCAKIRQLFCNFILYSSRGANKYRFIYDEDCVIPIADRRYTIGFTHTERKSIYEAVNDVFLTCFSRKPTKTDLSITDIESHPSHGPVCIRIRFGPNCDSASSLANFMKLLKSKLLNVPFLQKQPSVISFEHSINIYITSKVKAMRDLAEHMGIKKIHFFGDDHTGTDSELFEPQEWASDYLFEAIKVGNPQYTLSILSSTNMDGANYASGWNPLRILKNKMVNDYLKHRLSVYWAAAGLPGDWVKPIIDLLADNIEKPENALVKLFKAYPQLATDPSPYQARLRSFRASKVKNLTKRISPYIRGTVFLDVGGRAQDIAKSVLDGHNAVNLAFVTDIAQFQNDSTDPRIRLVWQSEGDRISLPDESVDTALLSMVLHHIDRKTRRRLMSQLTKLVRPGGRIFVFEDSCPKGDGRIRHKDPFAGPIIDFSEDERFQILGFLDWFGNTVTRNRREFSYVLTYENMEYWERLFESFGYSTIHSEFVSFNKNSLDLMPPKAFMVFEREASITV